MTQTEIKINYWRKYWVGLFDNFLISSHGLELNSPHVLIDDIILEIKENQLRNEENKKYFYSKMNDFLENDLVINGHFKSYFKILRSNFNSKKDGYILQIANQIKSEFNKGIYFDRCMSLLEGVLFDDKEIDSDFLDVKYYTESLIIEYIKKGYDIIDISKFLSNIFNPYKMASTHVMTNFPHGMNVLSYPKDDDKYDTQKFHADLKSYLDSLTLKEKFDKLSYYYYKPKTKVQYVFVAEGLKGNEEIKIGDVTFYSPLSKRIAVVDKLESEDLQEDYKEKFLQIAVSVDHLSDHSSLQEAIGKAEIALDLFYCFYNFRESIEINASKYVIIDSSGEVILSSNSNSKKRFSKYAKSLYIEDIKDRLESKINSSLLSLNNPHEINSKIINALHWYRKGYASIKQEDQILNFWIAIENLFNLENDIKTDIFDDSKKGKFNIIQEIVACCEAGIYIYNYGWELYNYYRNLIDSQLPNRRSIPDSLIEKAQLNKNSIRLKYFIESLDEIKKYENDIYYQKKIDETIKFYTDKKSTKAAVIDHIQDVKIDILRIYRFRNLIVHNAYYDNAMLPYLSWKIKLFTGNLLRRIIFHIEKNQTMSSFFLQIYFDNEKLLLDLESGKLDFFED